MRWIYHYLLSVTLVLFVFPTSDASDPVASELRGLSWSLVSTDKFDSVDWSLDGVHLILANYNDAYVSVLDWRNQETVWSFPKDVARYNSDYLVLSRDGRLVAINQQNSIQVVNLQEQNILRTIMPIEWENDSDPLWTDIAWGPDSRTLATLTNGGAVELIDIDTGQRTLSFYVAVDPIMRGEEFLYLMFAWSPDGAYFAAPYYIPEFAPLTATIGFWDEQGAFLGDDSVDSCPAYGQLLFEVFDLDWASDDQSLAVAGANGIGICQIGTDGSVDNLTISDSSPTVLEWSTNRDWLAAADAFSEDCALQLYDVSQGQAQLRTEVIDEEACGILSLSWSADSQYIALATNAGVWVGSVE